LYDIIVPKDNLLQKINDLIDFSFIHDELLEKYCHTNGRHAESPIKMFKYLLLKAIYSVSDVDVVERSRYDMSFKYFHKDAGMFVCPAGHLAIRKARQGKKNIGQNQADTYYFDVEKCKACPLREGCYKEGSNARCNGHLYCKLKKNPEIDLKRRKITQKQPKWMLKTQIANLSRLILQ